MVSAAGSMRLEDYCHNMNEVCSGENQWKYKNSTKPGNEERDDYMYGSLLLKTGCLLFATYSICATTECLYNDKFLSAAVNSVSAVLARDCFLTANNRESDFYSATSSVKRGWSQLKGALKARHNGKDLYYISHDFRGTLLLKPITQAVEKYLL